jgi:uncharacterized membrane protein (UPF0182 family)
MDIERETVVEAAISVMVVALFVVLILGVGSAFGGASGLSERGALALVASIFGFVVVMTGVGYFLSRQ